MKIASALALTVPFASGFSIPSTEKLSNLGSNEVDPTSSGSSTSRRNFFSAAAAGLVATQLPIQPAGAVTGGKDGNLPDLPSEAVRSYLQYRIPLQIAADFYIFDLQDMVGDIEKWGEVGQLFRVNNNRGQGQPSKIERDFVNPMRILLLSMPPDVADDMRNAQFRFEKAMNSISKATAGYRKDLPVEIPRETVNVARAGWEDGRVALNDFFGLLNGVTGLPELKAIPAPGPKQREEYGRSARRYNELIKKTKLCQNRGGPALSQAWGQLMVSGYLQDSCGIPDLDGYFYQT
eukprot:CAMPEP_0176090746 /NCGR_PEP_ID=MMETSP0120_2-20121206/45447_1 /TAXON_ID=160619 /ORGANISM="Kryptoperidinium foliaceum, Strain CCMP 1326" /LENGTH=291 /DNA_ID=CAMNT_0017424627 /DNA_START=44 /DNA_END=919 /DNA_ORIENTATION=+